MVLLFYFILHYQIILHILLHIVLPFYFIMVLCNQVPYLLHIVLPFYFIWYYATKCPIKLSLKSLTKSNTAHIHNYFYSYYTCFNTLVIQYYLRTNKCIRATAKHFDDAERIANSNSTPSISNHFKHTLFGTSGYLMLNFLFIFSPNIIK